MYRRLLLIGLFLVGALVLGIGCGMAKTPITMWLSSQPATINEWAAVFEEDFNKQNPDLQLSIEIYPNVTLQREKLYMAMAAGIAPDIVYDSANVMSQWVSNNVALPLDKYFNSWSGRNDMIPDVLNWVRFDDQLYGLPYSIWSIGDVYNMDLFAAVAIDRPQTWADMIAAAKRLTKVGADGRVEVIGYNSRVVDLNSFVEVQAAMEQLGSTVIEVGAATANLNSDAAHQALSYIREVTQAGYPGTTGGTTDITMMLRGAMGIYHSFYGYNLTTIADAITSGGHNLEYHRFVGPTRNTDAIHGNGGMLFIPRTSNNPDAAWRVIEAFLAPQNLKGYLLAHGAALPARRSLHTDRDLRALPWNTELMTVLQPPILAYGNRHFYATDFRTQAGAHFKEAILGLQSVEAALEQAQSVIDSIVAEKMAQQ
jgi:multiple sugar transport system substrate-binding protein